MKRAIITLKNDNVFLYKSKYIWDYKDELNNITTPFIQIGNYTIRKDEIRSIEIYDDVDEENEGNE
jgi:hypothetical protein